MAKNLYMTPEEVLQLYLLQWRKCRDELQMSVDVDPELTKTYSVLIERVDKQISYFENALSRF